MYLLYSYLPNKHDVQFQIFRSILYLLCIDNNWLYFVSIHFSFCIEDFKNCIESGVLKSPLYYIIVLLKRTLRLHWLDSDQVVKKAL